MICFVVYVLFTVNTRINHYPTRVAEGERKGLGGGGAGRGAGRWAVRGGSKGGWEIGVRSVLCYGINELFVIFQYVETATCGTKDFSHVAILNPLNEDRVAAINTMHIL